MRKKGIGSHQSNCSDLPNRVKICTFFILNMNAEVLTLNNLYLMMRWMHEENSNSVLGSFGCGFIVPIKFSVISP